MNVYKIHVIRSYPLSLVFHFTYSFPLSVLLNLLRSREHCVIPAGSGQRLSAKCMILVHFEVKSNILWYKMPKKMVKTEDKQKLIP